MQIPLARPSVSDADVKAVLDVLQSDRLALGPWAERFEAAMAAYVGVRCAVAVNSGTSALHLVIRALDIGPGDEVITTPFSFIASTNCVLYEGATPVLVDIDPETLCIDPTQIERAITKNTKAVLAVDVFGRPADWPTLESIADDREIALIEDSAEALGSEAGGRRCGSFGCAGIFGFYPNKQITTGEGGAVVTDDESLAGLCRSMANQGRGEGDRWLQHERLGFNYRMCEMSAALGCSQIARIDEIVSERRRVASWYEEALADEDGIAAPREPVAGVMSWFVYVVRLGESFNRKDRDAILEGLRLRGIGCSDYFQPIHLQPFVRQTLGTKPGDFPITEAVSERTIALPFYVGLTEIEVSRIAATLVEEVAKRRRAA